MRLLLGLLVLVVLCPSAARAADPKECEAVVKRVGEAAAGLARVNPALRENRPDELERAGKAVESAGAELGKLPVSTDGVKKVTRELGQLFGRIGRSLRDLADAVRTGNLKARTRIHDEFRVQQEEMLRVIRGLKDQCQPSAPEVPT